MHRCVILACALILAGCGGSTVKQRQETKPPSQAERMKAVVRAWSARLNAGNNTALPSSSGCGRAGCARAS